MQHRYQLIAGWAIIVACPLLAEDVISAQVSTVGTGASSPTQIALPVNTWVNLSGSTTGTQIDYLTGYDSFKWYPALGRLCGMEGYREPSSEPNRSWYCYSFAENRMDLWDDGSPWHSDDMPEGGHTMGTVLPDQTTSVAHGPCCNSGSNLPDNPRWGDWDYDLYAQVGREKLGPNSIRYSTQNATAAYDPANQVLILQGGDSGAQGTMSYSLSTNTWTGPLTTTGTAPPAGIINASSAYDSTDGNIYLFGGFTTVAENALYKYNAATATWTQLSPTGGPPSAREAAGFAYDAADDIFLLYGGTPDNSTFLNDTWVYDPEANTWTQLTPTVSPTSPTQPTWQRLVWIPETNVFVGLLSTGQAWAYRYVPGGPCGTQAYIYSPTAGSLNRVSGNAKDGAVVASGSTLYQFWHETTTGNSTTGLLHPYAQSYQNGTTTDLGATGQAMSPNDGTAELESYSISAGMAGTTPWACWYQLNLDVSGSDSIQCKGWNAGSWSLGGTVPLGNTSGSAGVTVLDGPLEMAVVGSNPTVIYREQDKTTANIPTPAYAYVAQWNGSSFIPLGGSLNSGATYADSVSIASDGVKPWIAWTQYGFTPTSEGINFIAPQVNVEYWGGSSWSSPCASSANVSASEYAFSVSLTYMGTQPYVAFVERTASGNAQLYVRTCVAGSWSTIGSGALNRDSNNGWAYHPQITNDGTNLYLTWTEQGNEEPWLNGNPLYSSYDQRPHIYVAEYSSGSWALLGGALNADTVYGSAVHPSITMYGSEPVVQWNETTAGSLRQVYAKQWSGTDWAAITAPFIPSWHHGHFGNFTISGSGSRQ